jgi:hypothetical protein
MCDGDRRLTRRVAGKLVVGPEVDCGADAVVAQRLPAALRQAANRVRPHDHAEARLAAAFERQAAEIPHVDATVPHEDAGQGVEVPSRP